MKDSCAFCREPAPAIGLEMIKKIEERVDKGDLVAMYRLAGMYRDGEYGVARDEAKALELICRAADLGSPEALRKLGYYLLKGEPGLVKDQEKGLMCMEDAAKKGDVRARYNLGVLEEPYQHHDLAIKHFKLAAAAGHKDAMKRLWKYFPSDKLTKATLIAPFGSSRETAKPEAP